MSTRAETGAAVHDVAAVQRRTVRTLVVSQAVGAVGVTIGVATASLLARDISGSETMAGLAQTFQVLGTAAASYALARVMRRRGRRVGLVAGYLLGATGAVPPVAGEGGPWLCFQPMSLRTGGRVRFMMRRACWTLAVMLLFSWPVAAQDATMNGVVTDESGAVLPGAAVTATGLPVTEI